MESGPRSFSSLPGKTLQGLTSETTSQTLGGAQALLAGGRQQGQALSEVAGQAGPASGSGVCEHRPPLASPLISDISGWVCKPLSLLSTVSFSSAFRPVPVLQKCSSSSYLRPSTHFPSTPTPSTSPPSSAGSTPAQRAPPRPDGHAPLSCSHPPLTWPRPCSAGHAPLC